MHGLRQRNCKNDITLLITNLIANKENYKVCVLENLADGLKHLFALILLKHALC